MTLFIHIISNPQILSSYALSKIYIIITMIDSALFSRATSFENMDEWKGEGGDIETQVNRSTLYHLLLSFTSTIH